MTHCSTNRPMTALLALILICSPASAFSLEAAVGVAASLAGTKLHRLRRVTLLPGGDEITDQVGSVRYVLNTRRGIVAQRFEYDPFGNIIDAEGDPTLQPFRFAGGLYDDATGLLRFGARNYDPEVGRWTAKDPILFAGGDTNLYAYVLNDPINHVDPTGRFFIIAGIAVAGIVNGFAEAQSGGSFAGGFGRGFVGGTVGAAVGVVAASIGGGPATGAAVATGTSNLITTSLNELFSDDGWSDNSIARVTTATTCGVVVGALGGAAANGVSTAPGLGLNQGVDDTAFILETLLGNYLGTGAGAGVVTAGDHFIWPDFVGR